MQNYAVVAVPVSMVSKITDIITNGNSSNNVGRGNRNQTGNQVQSYGANGNRQNKKQNLSSDLGSNKTSNRWDQKLISRMWQDSDKQTRSFLKFLASKPGVSLTSSEIVSQFRGGNLNPNTIQNISKKIRSRVKSNYGVQTTPFIDRYNGSEHEFLMPTDIAKFVNQVGRGNQQSSKL